MIRCIFFLFFLSGIVRLAAQEDTTTVGIAAMSISREDDFTSWDLYSSGEEPVGYIRLRWAVQNDWSEWDYRIGETTGQVKQRSKGDPNIWELRSGNRIITMKTIYTGDFNQWRITDDSQTLTYKTMYENVYDGWKTSSKAGEYEVYTQWEMDPRDWIINDKMKSTIDEPFKIAMIFLSSFYSSPKY